jgi:hypothetical protein
MADFFPFDSGPGSNVTEAQWGLMAKNWMQTGVIKGALNEHLTYADSSGLQVKVKSGNAWIQGFFFQTTAETILPISTPDVSNPRIDRVAIQVDWTNNNISLVVLQGTPAASPTPPALTQSTAIWQISLAQVYVGANVSTIAAGNITDERFPSPLITPTLLNGWVKNYQCHFWKDPDGTVNYNLAIMNGSTGVNTTIMIFPAGYRPGEQEMHTGFANGTSFVTQISNAGYLQNLQAMSTSINVVLKGSFKAAN